MNRLAALIVAPLAISIRLSRHFSTLLSLALLLTLFVVPVSGGMTQTVTSLADDGSSGTLRSVIASANAGDIIMFNVTGTITLTQGQLEINKTLTINGPGPSSLSISGGHSSSLFQIDSSAIVTISSLTMQDGLGGVNGGLISNNGSLKINKSILLMSTPSNGEGGGIFNAGSLTVTDSSFVGSPDFGIAADGGGILNKGIAVVSNSTFSSLIVGGFGGAILNAVRSDLTVSNSTFSQNSANAGGAILNNGSCCNAAGNGGATIQSSTFWGNGASQGGGVYNLNATTKMKNTILANEPNGGNCYVNGGDTSGSLVSYGYNLSDDNTCTNYLNQTGDRNNTPAGLDPGGLMSNGGPTPTIAILPSSSAFNVIPLSPTNYCTATDGTPISTDQRGVPRPQVAACDIGAFEYGNDDDSSLAQLSGGNVFNGNQTIAGTVAASSFVGNGSGLSGVTSSNLNCAGCVGNTQLAINYAGSASQGGPANNALLFGGRAPDAFASIGSNTFAGTQMMPALSVVGGGTFGNIAYNGYAVVGTSGSAVGVVGNSNQGYGVFGNNTSGGVGVFGTSASGVGVRGESAGTSPNQAAGVFNNYASTASGDILLGQFSGVNKFIVDSQGDVTASGNIGAGGNLSAVGSLVIGGGTPIAEYVSVTYNLNVPALTPGTCQTFTTAALNGFAPGASDTIALGTPSALVSGLGSGLFLMYQAWETTTTASPTVTIQVCNPTAVKYKGGASGTIRIDVFKH